MFAIEQIGQIYRLYRLDEWINQSNFLTDSIWKDSEGLPKMTTYAVITAKYKSWDKNKNVSLFKFFFFKYSNLFKIIYN